MPILLPLSQENSFKSSILSPLSKLRGSLASPRNHLWRAKKLREEYIGKLARRYNKAQSPDSSIETPRGILNLNSTLYEEVPAYFRSFRKGLALIFRRLAELQADYWRSFQDKALAFCSLRAVLEGISDGGEAAKLSLSAAETVTIWQRRFGGTEHAVADLGIIKRSDNIATPRRTGGERRRSLYSQRTSLTNSNLVRGHIKGGSCANSRSHKDLERRQ